MKTFFLLFTDIFRGKHELLVGTWKILAIDFSLFRHPDRKRLPIHALGYVDFRYAASDHRSMIRF